MSRWMVGLVLVAACGGTHGTSASAATPASSAADGDPGRVPDGYVRMEVEDVVTSSQGEAVLLIDSARTRVLPIFIGGTEAVSIALRLHNRAAPRPLTHDLLDSVLRRLGGRLVKVQVDGLVGTTFVGSIFIVTQQGTLRVDARPSDAIALAIGNRVPIYVARSVLEQSGVKPPEVDTTEASAGRRPGPAT